MHHTLVSSLSLLSPLDLPCDPKSRLNHTVQGAWGFDPHRLIPNCLGNEVLSLAYHSGLGVQASGFCCFAVCGILMHGLLDVEDATIMRMWVME